MTLDLILKRIAALFAGVLLLAACGGKDEPETPEDEEVTRPKIETISIMSTELNRSLGVTIWLPQGYDENKEYPFLYLLHGYGDDNNSWNQKGGASTIASKYVKGGGLPMVIIMPDALTSFYIGNYESYMHNTLMPKVESLYHCNGKRALAGLSMGGYGTLYHALKYPEKFMYAYAMSPATDEAGFSVLASQHPVSVYPPITIESGTQDYTVGIEGVRSCVNALQSCGLVINFIERDGGHDWNFWPVCLEKALVKIGNTFKN